MSILNLWWIVPLAFVAGFSLAAFAWVSSDPHPEKDESHSATRYAPEPGESPIAREARKAAEVGTARPEKVEGARLILKYGTCLDHDDITCSNCPGPNSAYVGWECHLPVKSARQWLLDHGINPDEANK